MSLTDHQVRYYFREEAVQEKIDYDGNGNIVYQGYAKPGAATSGNIWIIFKMTYDVSNRVTAVQVVLNKAWDNRASLTYT